MASKYVLTFDFRIIFCKNINLRIGLKELNSDNLSFIPYNEDPSIIDYGYELANSDVGYIINTVFNNKKGYQLQNKEMLWLETFENKLKLDSNILNNKKLAFNYLILKLLLIGFSEEMAIDIIRKYYELIEDNIEVPNIIDVINKINKFIDKKEYWVSNNIYENQLTEINFLTKILNEKRVCKFNFDFNDYKDEYFKLCYNSLIMDNYKYNSKYSYLVNNPKNLNAQKEYLLEIYSSTIGMLLNYLIQTDFMDFYSEDRFINTLVDEMITVINTFLNVVILKIEDENK